LDNNEEQSMDLKVILFILILGAESGMPSSVSRCRHYQVLFRPWASSLIRNKKAIVLFEKNAM
jgi:hypothetical protein